MSEKELAEARARLKAEGLIGDAVGIVIVNPAPGRARAVRTTRARTTLGRRTSSGQRRTRTASSSRDEGGGGDSDPSDPPGAAPSREVEPPVKIGRAA